jgi:hypothetical protein
MRKKLQTPKLTPKHFETNLYFSPKVFMTLWCKNDKNLSDEKPYTWAPFDY